jgi:5-methylcytosine-specific restriction enzyme A
VPTVPKQSVCTELGCQNPRSIYNSKCIDHGGRDKNRGYKAVPTKERAEFNSMYNTRQWLTLRKIQLSKYPLCAGCNADGIVTPANTVDHIFPWSAYSKEAFFINYFQSLCPTHHAYKTQLEQEGIYRRYGPPTIDYKQSDYHRLLR